MGNISIKTIFSKRLLKQSFLSQIQITILQGSGPPTAIFFTQILKYKSAYVKAPLKKPTSEVLNVEVCQVEVLCINFIAVLIQDFGNRHLAW